MKIVENVYSVGVKDDKVRIFHGYAVPYGTTYNAYLITGEKNVLIDLVKAPFSELLLDNINNIIGEKNIDYIICNHVEEDHSGALPEVMQKYPNATIYCSMAGKKELEIFYKDVKANYIAVKADEEITLGDFSYKFIPMPMVHWPDSLSTYLIEKKILFSNDALGQHIACEGYDSDLGENKLLDRAADYYANIVLPFGMQVIKLLDNVLKNDISLICPSHGVILKEYISEMVAKYRAWATGYVNENKVVIVYDSMWGTTTKMANLIKDNYAQKGLTVLVFDLAKIHYSATLKDILETKYLIVGSPTLNNNMMPSVSAFLTYVKGLKPKNKTAQAFGSYGWSGESVGQINDTLANLGYEMLDQQKVQWKI